MGRVSDAKQRLLDATLDLVWGGSYGAVTVDDICERASVKKGSFYYFFKSKNDLVVAAFDTHWEAFRPQLDQIFSPTVPPLDRIRNYFDAAVQKQLALYAKSGQIFGCPYGAVGSEVSACERAICDNIQQKMGLMQRYFETAIRDAQADRSVPAVADAGVLAKRLMAYYQGVMSQARIQNDPDVVKSLPENVLSLVGAAPEVAQ